MLNNIPRLKFACIFLIFGFVQSASADTLIIEASKDTTLYSEGDLSNGQGISIFAGRTMGRQGTGNRRALLQFNLEDVLPRTAEIESATLWLYVSKVPSDDGGDYSFKLHRLTRDWGEGASDAGDFGGKGAAAETGDATWTEVLFGVESWTQPGGDFEAAVSAEQIVSDIGYYDWAGEQFTADIEAWRSDPLSNFGWILIAEEDQSGSARRFESRHYWNENQRPRLVIEFTNTWSGYPIDPDGVNVDTGAYLGWVNIEHDPWIWVYSLGGYLYMPEDGMEESGNWVWAP